jgi:hypothetical protein
LEVSDFIGATLVTVDNADGLQCLKDARMLRQPSLGSATP